MGQKSVLNGIFDPFRALGSVRNGFATYVCVVFFQIEPVKAPNGLEIVTKSNRFPLIVPEQLKRNTRYRKIKDEAISETPEGSKWVKNIV